MKKIATIHQPNYLPWIGLFSKVSLVDYFIFADTFIMGNQGFFNRNKIRTNNGWMYLTIPIQHKNRVLPICDIPSPLDKTWQTYHWQAILSNYSRTEFFQDYKDFFIELYIKDFKYVCQLNMEIIIHLLECFNIKVEIIKASDLAINPNLHKTRAIISMLKSIEADTYLSGPSGKEYLEFEQFQQNNIELKFSDFHHPIYKQRFPGFEENMAAIDLLFNVGLQAAEIVKLAGSIRND